jgi:hypothetical protein
MRTVNFSAAMPTIAPPTDDTVPINPDSAVAAEAMSKEQTFRSQGSLSLRLIRLGRKWVCASERTSIVCGSTGNLKLTKGEVRSSEKDFETLELGAFATPGLLLAQGL